MKDSNQDDAQIASNIIHHINQNNLIKQDISSLDRIIHYYFLREDRSKNEDKQVIDFMFRCLDEGPQFSILFTHLGNSKEFEYAVKRLYKEYQDKFDFNIINYSLFKCTYQSINYTEYLKYIFCFSVIILPLFFISAINFFAQNEKSAHKAEITVLENNKLKEELKMVKQNNTDLFNKNIELKDQLKFQKNLIDNHFTNFKENLKTEIQYDEESKARKNAENEFNKAKIKLVEVEYLNDQLKKDKEKIENKLTKTKTKLEEVELLNDQLTKDKDEINKELSKTKTKLEEVELLNDQLTKDKDEINKELSKTKTKLAEVEYLNDQLNKDKDEIAVFKIAIAIFVIIIFALKFFYSK